MRRLAALLAVHALLVAGCATSSAGDEDLAPLAEQADRVADLLDADRPCQAAEAARTLQTLAGPDVSADVRAAVTAFASSAASSIGCPARSTEPQPQPEAEERDAPQDDDGGGDRGGDRDDDEPKDDEPKGNGGDGDHGRGNGRGRGNDD